MSFLSNKREENKFPLEDIDIFKAFDIRHNINLVIRKPRHLNILPKYDFIYILTP